ncbi:MAG: hypothetical protein ACKVOH_04915, partial [Chlamydiales bacterium]
MKKNIIFLSTLLSAATYCVDIIIPPDQTTSQILSDEGDTLTVEADGEVAVTGTYAILMNSTNQTVLNNGLIESDFTAIFDNGVGAANNVITNNGNILTSGSNTRGMVAHSDGVVITNTNNITTSGSHSMGIVTFGNSAIINNSGTINVMAFFSFGIENFGANARVTNSGTITTGGDTIS